MGGIEPTSLKYKLVEVDDSQVYALDLASMRWQQLSPVNSVANLQIPLQIADADIIRANRRCAEEKARGLSLG